MQNITTVEELQAEIQKSVMDVLQTPSTPRLDQLALDQLESLFARKLQELGRTDITVAGKLTSPSTAELSFMELSPHIDVTVVVSKPADNE
jgi:hypothetical protein